MLGLHYCVTDWQGLSKDTSVSAPASLNPVGSVYMPHASCNGITLSAISNPPLPTPSLAPPPPRPQPPSSLRPLLMTETVLNGLQVP